MAACSPSPIRSFALSGPLPSVYRSRSAVFLERVVARLRLHRDFTDSDLDDAVRTPLTGLVQSAA